MAEKTQRNWKRALKFLLFVAVVTAVYSVVVMALWNWLMPTLFGLPPISVWQALGLLVLSRILFGGLLGRAGRRMRWRYRMKGQASDEPPQATDGLP